MFWSSVEEWDSMKAKCKLLTLADVENVPLRALVEFYHKAREAEDNDVLQLGNHQLLVAEVQGLCHPCDYCSLRECRELCWVFPCLAAERDSAFDVCFFALAEEGGEHVRE